MIIKRARMTATQSGAVLAANARIAAGRPKSGKNQAIPAGCKPRRSDLESHPRVLTIENVERQGMKVYLADGWQTSEGEHILRAGNVAECLRELVRLDRCDCKRCVRS